MGDLRGKKVFPSGKESGESEQAGKDAGGPRENCPYTSSSFTISSNRPLLLAFM